MIQFLQDHLPIQIFTAQINTEKHQTKLSNNYKPIFFLQWTLLNRKHNTYVTNICMYKACCEMKDTSILVTVYY